MICNIKTEKISLYSSGEETINKQVDRRQFQHNRTKLSTKTEQANCHSAE